MSSVGAGRWPAGHHAAGIPTSWSDWAGMHQMFSMVSTDSPRFTLRLPLNLKTFPGTTFINCEEKGFFPEVNTQQLTVSKRCWFKLPFCITFRVATFYTQFFLLSSKGRGMFQCSPTKQASCLFSMLQIPLIEIYKTLFSFAFLVWCLHFTVQNDAYAVWPQKAFFLFFFLLNCWRESFPVHLKYLIELSFSGIN